MFSAALWFAVSAAAFGQADAGFQKLSRFLTQEGGAWKGTLKQKDKVIEVERLEIKSETASPCGHCEIPSLRLVGLDIPSKFTLLQVSGCGARGMWPSYVSDELLLSVRAMGAPPDIRYECSVGLLPGDGSPGGRRFTATFRARINIIVNGDQVTGDISADDIPPTEFSFSRIRDSNDNPKPEERETSPPKD